MRPSKILFAGSVIVITLAQFGFASLIPIVNPNWNVQVSVSDPTPVLLSSGAFTYSLGSTYVDTRYSSDKSQSELSVFVPGWSGSNNGDVIVYNPQGLGTLSGDSSTHLGEASAGPGDSWAMTQQLTQTFLAGTYTLTVDVGLENNSQAALFGGSYAPAGVVVSLTGAGTASLASSPTEVAGGFVQFSRTYVINPGDPNIGGPIGITLGSSDIGATGTMSEALFDNVSLQYTAVPEPASAGAIAIPAAMALLRRRRINV
jgi:hypothetical protein